MANRPSSTPRSNPSGEGSSRLTIRLSSGRTVQTPLPTHVPSEPTKKSSKAGARVKEIVQITADSLPAREALLRRALKEQPALASYHPTLCSRPAVHMDGRFVVYVGQLLRGMTLPIGPFGSQLISDLQLTPQQIGGTGWRVIYCCEALLMNGIPVTVPWFLSKFTPRKVTDRYGVDYVTFSLNKGHKEGQYHPFGRFKDSESEWMDAPIRIDCEGVFHVLNCRPFPDRIVNISEVTKRSRRLYARWSKGAMFESVDDEIRRTFGGKYAQVSWVYFMGTDEARSKLPALPCSRELIDPRPRGNASAKKKKQTKDDDQLSESGGEDRGERDDVNDPDSVGSGEDDADRSDEDVVGSDDSRRPPSSSRGGSARSPHGDYDRTAPSPAHVGQVDVSGW